MTAINTKRSLLVLLAVLCASLFGVAKLHAQVFGQWDFDSGNLNATTGSPLTYNDSDTQTQTAFGSTTTLAVPNIAGNVAQLMKFPAATNATMGYGMTTPAANGRGLNVDNYTLLADVLFPAGSDAKLRSIIQTDQGLITAGADFVVTSGNQLSADGVASGGTINPNTWYRIGFVVMTNEIFGYVDGNQVFSASITSGANLDRFDLPPSSTVPILGDGTTNTSFGGYVNSIQLRQDALSEGQMAALGTAQASGIPSTIPPVPSFIRAGRTPGVGQTGVAPSPAINIVLDQGSTTVNGASIQLYLDGVLRSPSVTPTPPTFTVTDSVNTLLDPNSVHTLSLTWSDNVAGQKTNTWSFTVLNYQSVTLPSPFYMENFDELTEGTLPSGWVATNATTAETSGIDYCDPTSDAYMNWVVISTNRPCSCGFECDTFNQNPIAVNGSLINNLANGNMLYFESDNRCNGCYGQIGVLFTADINCTGRTNVFVGFNSLYTQNQDSIGALEYSIDQGVHWLPVLYYLDDQSPAVGGDPDVIRTNGVVDVGATFNTARGDQPANGTNYGFFICAPVSSALIPYVAGRTNDDQVSGKRIEIVRLSQADGQANVRFRFVYAGTCSWYWGVDNFGLYEINTPVITTPPVSQTVDASTPATFTVAASSPTPLTYQWKFNGANILNATNSSYNIPSAQTANQGSYQVIVHNSSGSTPSTLASLTVNTNPAFASGTAGLLVSQVADPGQAVSLSPTISGGRPLTYLWFKNNTLLPSATSFPLSFSAITTNDSGNYMLVLSNSYGMVTSSVATVTVYVGPITSNLVAHLTMDGNLNDSSGRGNNATYAYNGTSPDTTPTFINGKIGQAFQYTTLVDGSKNDYATFGYPADLQLDDTVPFSVSMWVNYTNQSDDLPFISNKDWNSSGNRGWGVFCQGGGNFRVQVTGVNGNSDKFSVSPNTVLRGGTWHNLVVSFVRAPGSSAGYVNSYVDGALVNRSVMIVQGNIDTFGTTFNNEQSCASGNPPLPDNQTDWAVNIGQDGTGVYHDQCSAYNIGAYVDDLGVWRRALTGAEALAIYNAGNAGKDLSQAVTGQRLFITQSGSNMIIKWAGSPTLQLYKSTSLNPTSWVAVPGTLGNDTATVAISGSAAYFKLGQ